MTHKRPLARSWLSSRVAALRPQNESTARAESRWACGAVELNHMGQLILWKRWIDPQPLMNTYAMYAAYALVAL
ncbi:hypothetical protein ABIF64_006617 [Bradyrhizobium japonicum]